jgi:two-component system, chemotaxis family, chemotaxis protein CheY
LCMARVLIVDDSKFMRNIIRETLEEAGHVVVAEADNGVDGIRCYREMKPDVVTMDITMSGTDGIKAVREITLFDPDVRVIVLSALSEQTIKINDPDVNARAYLTKPFAKTELVNCVARVLG